MRNELCSFRVGYLEKKHRVEISVFAKVECKKMDLGTRGLKEALNWASIMPEKRDTLRQPN